MQKRVMLQAGHWNTTTGETGAPGEQELNKRIMLRLKDILISKGFQLFLVDWNPPASQLEQDFDLYLALHGDADAPGISGGCVGFPDPSQDEATVESQRIAQCLVDEYFKNTGINNVPGKITNDIKYYYMWSRLTARTPCVLIEMGEVQDPHDKVILADTDRVAFAIVRGICKAFNVNFDAPTSQPTSQPQVDNSQLIADLKKQIELKQNKIDMLQETINNFKLAFTHIKEDIPNF